jgi:dipeptidyl-peptidase-4
MTNTTSTSGEEGFPRLAARTMNFTLGAPRNISVSPDGERVVFLRTASGTDRRHDLWVFDVSDRVERKVADAATLLKRGGEDLTAAERARRERMRVGTSGIVAYSTDREMTAAVFALSSRLFHVGLLADGESGVREIPTTGGVIDPRIDPTGRRIAFAADRSVFVVELTGDDQTPRRVAGPEADEPGEVVFGLAEFVAAEELDRDHGYWWSPDGQTLLVERYDESPVSVWHIADPARPDLEPSRVRYPAAGTPNAIVSLWLVDARPGAQSVHAVDWRSDTPVDGVALEYLAGVVWTEQRLVLSLLTRSQQRMEFRDVDPATGGTTLLHCLEDDAWVDVQPGVPRVLDNGSLLHTVNAGDAVRLAVDGAAFSPADLLVIGVSAARPDGSSVYVDAVATPGSRVLAEVTREGQVTFLTDPDGIALTAVGGLSGDSPVVVSQQRSLDAPAGPYRVSVGGSEVGQLRSLALAPPFRPEPECFTAGDRSYPVAVLFPRDHQRGQQKLPILLCPYGGPHGRMVVNSADAYLPLQWFADRGFCVVVADGRGMAGRGPAWDRLARNDFIGTIDDQVEVVAAVGERYPDDVDLTKVAMRGWSFGGYISALAVLKHPTVFHAAVAGAPVTDMRMYDTAYTERYLGHPDDNGPVYDRNSLLGLADQLRRPLQLIHGMVDDNVAVAHTLRLSQALLAAGKAHEVLPLTGTTHMPNSEAVAENLLLLQVDFLRRSLGIAAPA